METYEKREGTSAILGQWYEIKLIMLIVLQSIISGFNFKLANNIKLAGDFDDVVMNITFLDSTRKTVFLQAKHIENIENKKITLRDLKDAKSKFSLYKYFKSYQQIISNKSELCAKGLNVDNAEFIIYTNTDFDNSCASCFEKIEAPNALSVFNSKELIAYKIKYNNFENFINLFPICDKEKANEYLRELTFLVNQGNESVVEAKIKECITLKLDEYNQNEVSDNYLKAFIEYQAWWKSKGDVKFLTQIDDYFQTYSSVCLLHKLKNLETKFKNDINGKCIEFTHSCLERFAEKLQEAGSVELLTNPGAGLLTLAKILQFYKNKDVIFVDSEFVKQYSDKIECNFKHSEIITTLVCYVDDKSQSIQFITNILKNVKENFKKRLIVICDQQIACSRQFSVSLLDTIRYSDLSLEAQKSVANTHINFQDKFLCLKDVLGDCLSEMLNDDLLAKVLLKKQIKIANFTVENLEQMHYISRKLKKQLVSTYIIDKCSDAVLLIHVNEIDCRYKLCTASAVTFYPDSDANRKNVYYILPSTNKSKVFNELCEKYKNVHLLEYFNNNLRWIQSYGLNKLILENLAGHETFTESEIVDCCNINKLVVISDVAGMGKTTVLKSLANEVNKMYPGLWILKINLSQHAEVLQYIKLSQVKRNIFKTFLNSLKHSSEIERMFLSSMFAVGRVAVFLDGYDEISPDYEQIVIDLVKELQVLKVHQIYLTTRPQMREFIEINLHTLCFTFVALNTVEQVTFVRNQWLRNEDNVNHVKQELISSLAQKLINKMTSISCKRDIAICGIPLQLRMVVDIYPTYSEVNTIFKDSEILITLHTLYEKFLNKKIQVYCVEKLGLHSSNVTFKSDLERHIKCSLEEHQLIAMDLICGGLSNDIMLSENDKAKLAKIFEEPHVITRYGIANAVIHGHYVFTHRTFAEFLSAMYLNSKLEGQECKKFTKMFVRVVLTDGNYQVLRKFLNGMFEKKKICRLLLCLENLCENRALCYAGIQKLLWMPLNVAAEEKNINLLKCLLDDLVPRSRTTKLILNSYKGNYTVLQILVKSSVSSEYIEVINHLVSLGANVNLRTVAGESVLHLSGNNSIVLEQLLSLGAKVDQKQYISENDALLGAVSSSNIECVKLLISHGANVNWKDMKNNNSSMLHLASSNGNLQMVNCLLKHGATLNVKDNYKRSVLFVAARSGHLDTVKCLIELGANVNEKDIYGWSVLYVAARVGHQDVVKCLIRHGANVNNEDNDCWSVLYVAARNGHFHTVKFLVQHGANVNYKDNNSCSVVNVAARGGHKDVVKCLVRHGANINDKDKNDCSVLYVAASKGYTDTVKYLVEHGANVNDKYKLGISVLHAAASKGHQDVVKCLVDHGASVNYKDNDGWSVMYVAASEGHLNTVTFLLECGANVNDKINGSRSVLQEMAIKGHLEIVKCLLEHGANVNEKDYFGRSVLNLAANEIHIVRCLLQHGANINDKDRDDKSVMYVCASNGHLDKVKGLLEYGASVHEIDKDGRSVLYIAAKNGHLDTVKFLLAHGANINYKDNNGRSVLYAAAKRGNRDIVVCLIEHGANVNDKNNNGGSVLYVAALRGHLDIVKYLLEQGADANDKDNDGRSVLYVTAWNSHQDTVKGLVDLGANVNDRDNDDWSVLHVAAKRGNIDIIKCLVENGANVNSYKFGWSVLHVCARRGHLNIVKYLLEHGANVNDIDNNGRSVLQVAASLKIKKYLISQGAK